MIAFQSCPTKEVSENHKFKRMNIIIFLLRTSQQEVALPSLGVPPDFFVSLVVSLHDLGRPPRVLRGLLRPPSEQVAARAPVEQAVLQRAVLLVGDLGGHPEGRGDVLGAPGEEAQVEEDEGAVGVALVEQVGEVAWRGKRGRVIFTHSDSDAECF